MRRVIAIGIILVLPLLLLPSCAAGEISQEEYDKIVNDLAAIQTQIQSLQDDFNEAQALIQSLQGESAKVQPPTQPLPEEKGVTEEKPAEALAYAEYMDVLMYQLWKDSELTPRFDFADDTEWMMELRSRTSEMGDAELSNYATELEERHELAMEQLWFYCLDRIEKALK